MVTHHDLLPLWIVNSLRTSALTLITVSQASGTIPEETIAAEETTLGNG